MALKWVSFTAAFTEKMRSKDYLMDSFEVIHVFFFSAGVPGDGVLADNSCCCCHFLLPFVQQPGVLTVPLQTAVEFSMGYDPEEEGEEAVREKTF